MTNAPESDLVDAARYGDRPAFEQLIESQAGRVWRAAWRLVRQGQDAEEVTRETFLAACRTLPAYQAELRFDLWLVRIAIGRALKLLDRVADLRKPAATTPGKVVTMAEMEPAEAARRLSAARSRLAPALRAVIALHDVEGLGWDDISAVLAIPEPAARQRLWRARLSLWRLVTGHTELPREEQPGDELLSGYVDGELTAAERASVEKKLTSSPSFKALYEEIKTLRHLAAKDDEPPVPAGLVDRIRAELPEPEAGARRRPPRRPSGTRPTESSAALVAPRREFPVGLAVITLIVAGMVVGIAFFFVETHYGDRLWESIRGRFAGSAATAPAGTVENGSPANNASSPAAAPAATTGDATTAQPAVTPDATAAAPAATTQTAPTATMQTTPAATTDNTQAAPATTTAPAPATPAPAPAPQPTTPAPGPQPTSPAPAPQPAAPGATFPTTTAPAAPLAAAPKPSGPMTCTNTWTIPGGTLRWSGAVPENPKLVLGRIGVTLGGKAIAQPDATVRITVPASQWPALGSRLANAGVAVPSGSPSATFDCAAVVVSAP